LSPSKLRRVFVTISSLSLSLYYGLLLDGLIPTERYPFQLILRCFYETAPSLTVFSLLRLFYYYLNDDIIVPDRFSAVRSTSGKDEYCVSLIPFRVQHRFYFTFVNRQTHLTLFLFSSLVLFEGLRFSFDVLLGLGGSEWDGICNIHNCSCGN
jgi:hypothetical protein